MMTKVILEVALTAMCTVICGGTLYILKGFSNRLDDSAKDITNLKADMAKVSQRVTDNDNAIVRLRTSITSLETDNKALLAQINDNYQKLQLSIEDLKLRNAEMTAQFRQSDITHADIKRDVAGIVTYLYGRSSVPPPTPQEN